MNRPLCLIAVCVLLETLAISSFAQSSIVVPGTADPWLAGMPDGFTASRNDVAPAQSPVLATGFSLEANTLLRFTVSGSVDNTPNTPSSSPDGASFTSHEAGAENGISDVTAPINSLLGVFLTDDRPDLTPAPVALDFSGSLGLNFTTLAPALKQVFFIGDGLTSTGDVQTFQVPTGATRLYLGTMDSFEWSNNSGSFSVSVAVVPAPPALLVGLLGLLPAARKRRRAKVTGVSW